MKLTTIAEVTTAPTLASFSFKIESPTQYTVVQGIVPLGASSKHDDYQNTLRAMEQALYAAFFHAPAPTDRGPCDEAGDDHRHSE